MARKRSLPSRLELARRLAEIREAAGMTQADLAQATGVPARSISNWEQGDAAIPLEKAILLCQALGVELQALLVRPANADPSKPGRRTGHGQSS